LECGGKNRGGEKKERETQKVGDGPMGSKMGEMSGDCGWTRYERGGKWVSRKTTGTNTKGGETTM